MKKITKINNKNGIELYYYVAEDVDKVVILDTNKNYFEDIYIETSYYEEDKNSIIKMLEETTLEDMADYYGFKMYASKDELIKDQELDCTCEELTSNEYCNIFKVNNETYYVWTNI